MTGNLYTMPRRRPRGFINRMETPLTRVEDINRDWGLF